MTERLLEEVIDDMAKQYADTEYIYERFLDLLDQYNDEIDDPTTDQVAVLYDHFSNHSPRDLNEETLALMWVMADIVQWMYNDLPTQGELQDPEWLQEQADLWGYVWDNESEDETP